MTYLVKPTSLTLVGQFAVKSFIFLISIELCLRLLGFIIKVPQQIANWRGADGGVYRILALGESTTARTPGGNSWPEQLEQILNRRSPTLSFRVYNEGLSGTNAAFILARLKRNIKRYQPQLVITMMGINDANLSLRYQDDLITQIRLAVEDIRLVKAARWVAWAKARGWHLAFDASYSDNNQVAKPFTIVANRFINMGLAKRQEGNEEEAEGYFLYAIAADPDNDSAYRNLGWVYTQLSRWDEAEQMFRQVIELVNQNRVTPPHSNLDDTYTGLINVYRHLGFTQDQIYSRLAAMSRGSRDVLGYSNDETVSQFTVTESLESAENTAYHYQSLHKLLKVRNIHYIAMQYPNTTIQPLQKIFAGAAGVTLVSNEETFQSALTSRPYEALFVDHITRNFGHTTPEGSRLIAENLAETILSLITSQ